MTVAVKNEDGLRNRRFLGGIIQASDRMRAHRREIGQKPGCFRTLCGYDDSAGINFLAGPDQKQTFLHGMDFGIEHYRFGRQLTGQLSRNGTHALSRQASIAGGEHGKYEFEHFAGGAQVLLQKNARQEWLEEW